MNPKQILLIDSDPRTRSWVAIRLEAKNFRILEAASAAEAGVLLDSQEVHLVITEKLTEGGSQADDLFARLAREKRPFVLFSESSHWEGQWFVHRLNREKLITEVEHFFRSGAAPALKTAAKGRHILIIEDSSTLRGVIRRALEKGFPQDVIREASDGKQALSEMTQKKVDLIITDLEMPGMDGLTFLFHLKANPLLSKKPVLVFSSNITAELQERLKDLPRVRCLAKPAAQERIIEEVSLLLGDLKPV